MTDAERVDYMARIADVGVRAVVVGDTSEAELDAMEATCSFIAKSFAKHRESADVGTAFRLALDDAAGNHDGKKEHAYVLGR